MRSRIDCLRRFAISSLYGLIFTSFLFWQSPSSPVGAQTCTFTLNSTGQNFASGGGPGSLAVTASQPSCNWTATSNAPWISISTGASGTGNGSVGYSVSPNPTPSPRNGTMTIAGQTFAVTQDAGLAGLQFYPLPSPVRLLETRPGFSGCTLPGVPINANDTLTLPARTVCAGIPMSAAAVTGNITVVPTAGGFLTLFPSGSAQPSVASSNFGVGEITNNVFTVGLGGGDGAFNIFASAATHVIADVTGYYAPPGTGGMFFHPLATPVRLLETRAGFTGCFAPGTPLAGTGDPNADPNLDLLLQGRSPLPSPCNSIPASAQVLAGNATSVLPSGGGYLTIYPSGGARPTVASSNYAGSDVINGPFAVKLGADGKFKIYTFATTHLVVDILGYYSAEATDANGTGLLLTPLPSPVRLLETRPDFPGFPLTGCTRTNAPIPGNQAMATHTQAARNFCGLPAAAQALAGNVSVVNSTDVGFLTLFPGNLTTAPLVATSNYPVPATFGYNRHYFVGLGPADGTFKALTQFTTDLIVDVSGYFAPPPANQAPVVAAGADQTIMLPATTASLTGAASDDGLPTGTLTVNWSQVSGPGTVMFSAGNQAATQATFSTAGIYVLRLTGSDGLLAGSDEVQVTVNGGLAVNAGNDQVLELPNTAMLVGTVTGGSGTVTVEWSRVSGPGTVIFSNASATVTTAMFGVNGVYVLRLTALDGQTTLSDDVQVTVNADPTPPPPDPNLTAPPLNMTVATTIGTATEFLYTGGNPVQTGVAPGTIKPERAAVLKGRVLDKNNQPLPLVKVTVLNHPEFGQTLSRADGRFDLAVNGGGGLTVKYEKSGFVPVQRTDEVPWQDYSGIADVVMMGYDASVTFVDLLASTPIQVAQSSVSTDSAGTRRTTLMFKQGTTALMKLPGGAMAGLDKLHVRATEFTVGANGPNAMPGDLPGTSAYTYAAEYSLDEAVAANAIETTFSQPVVQYNENFLNFPVGAIIPSGAYDRAMGQWMASTSGRVVKILSLTGGLANLDLDGSGQPATDPQYAALDINTSERQALATLHAAGQVLWRVPIIHFSPWDYNWPLQPSPGAAGSGQPPPQCDTCKPDPCKEPGCILEIENQTLGEEIGVTGTPYFLRYSSERQQGRVSSRSLNISLSGAAIPPNLKRIDLTVELAGRTFKQSFPAQINQTTPFTWDGLDAYGRVVQGRQLAVVNVAYVYDGFYVPTLFFADTGIGVPFGAAIPARTEVTLPRIYRTYLGVFDARALALGGWTMNVHHFYDPVEHVLYEGNGARRSVAADAIGGVITTVAGNGGTSFAGEGIPATQASFGLASPRGVAVASDGSVYAADTSSHVVRRIAPSGLITTVAGMPGVQCSPSTAPCGDGGQATQAQLSDPVSVAAAPDGSLYISDAAHRVRKVTTNGLITTVAGTGEACASGTDPCGDGGPAPQARLNNNRQIAVAPDGTLYIADSDNFRVRRVGTDGRITSVAGSGNVPDPGCNNSGAPARQGCIRPVGVAAMPDGALYVSGNFEQGKGFAQHQLFRVGADGIINIVAGDDICSDTGDGGPAANARLCRPQGITRGPDNAIYIADGVIRIRRIGADGIIATVAGKETIGFSGDGGPATAAELDDVTDVAFGLDGSFYIADSFNGRIRRVAPPLPGFNNTDIGVPSSDGSELYQFNAVGRHLRTINTLTSANKYIFGYDGAGRLITVTDGDNNVTTIQRNGSGNPAAIQSPFNQLTSFTLNANGYLATITNPNNETDQFTSTAGGLLTSRRDSRNNQTVFSYDTGGRLIRDDDAANGFRTLARNEQNAGYTVTLNTALNRTTNLQVQELANDARQSATTLPNGLQATLLERANGTNTSTSPTGVAINATLGADLRWRMQAPLTTHLNTTTPGGLNSVQTFARSAALTDPTNLLSLATQNDTTSINGRIYTNNYLAATRTFVYTTPEARQTITTTDTQGRITARQFAGLDPAAYAYDARGRLMTATFGAGGSARAFSYAYHPASGFLSSLTNPLTQVISFARDNAGRVTQQTLPDTRVMGFGYDANGNLTSVTPPGRPAHTFTYTPVDLVASYTPPAVPGTGPTQFAYNLDKQLITLMRPDALTINLTYDAAGRLQTLATPSGAYANVYSGATGTLTSISAPGGQTLSFSYDGSLLTQTTWAGIVAGNVGHTFDDNFRVTAQSVNGANTLDFTYDNDNLLTGAGNLAITRHTQNGFVTGTSLGGVSDMRGYNSFGELASYSASFNATPLYALSFTRDKLGRITQKVETIQGGGANTYDYSYDVAGRLVEVKLNTITLSAYAYDGNSNRASYNGTVTGAYDAQDRMTAYGATTYAYTANGELSSKTAGAQTTTYSYDVLGNLRQVTLPGGTQLEYVIDGQNRRVGKKLNGVLAQCWLYQNQIEPVAELDGAGVIVSRFVYGSRAHVPDYLIKGGATYRIITDHLGSVRLVVDVATGAIAERLDYDEFGVVTMDSNPGFQPFGFAGGLYDPQTKLVRFGARDYDAETGRWTAKDPILFAGGDTNLYGYAANNPVNLIDPLGSDPINFAQLYRDLFGGNNNSNNSGNGGSGFDPSKIKEIDPNENVEENLMGVYSPTPVLPENSIFRKIRPKPKCPTDEQLKKYRELSLGILRKNPELLRTPRGGELIREIKSYEDELRRRHSPPPLLIPGFGSRGLPGLVNYLPK